MANDLLTRLRDSRKFTVEVGHITFIGVCPPYARLLNLINEGGTDAQIAALSIHDWSGMLESDIFPDCEDKLVPWDPELFADLIENRKEWWTPISMKTVEIVSKSQSERDAQRKNLASGSIPKISKGSSAPKVSRQKRS